MRPWRGLLVEEVLAAEQRRALVVNDSREKKQRACQPLKDGGLYGVSCVVLVLALVLAARRIDGYGQTSFWFSFSAVPEHRGFSPLRSPHDVWGHHIFYSRAAAREARKANVSVQVALLSGCLREHLAHLGSSVGSAVSCTKLGLGV